MDKKDVMPSDIRQERLQQVVSMPTDALALHLRTTWAEAELIQRSIALYPDLLAALEHVTSILSRTHAGRDTHVNVNRRGCAACLAVDQARAVIERCEGGAS